MRFVRRAIGQLAKAIGGSSAIEFAILAPVFLLMCFGMIAYAIYFGAMHSVQQLAADAARTAVAGLDEVERNALVAAFITNNAGDYVFLDAAEVEYEIGDKAGDPSQYQVTIRYDAAGLPIWSLYPPLPLPEPVMVQRYSIRKGGS